jgi:crotonobetainyl-CoA:carnitine CoA-transferase CaiB-like acyl-CoA transferase
VPTGAVNSVAEALTDPHVSARGLVVEAAHPVYGTVKSLASPVRVGSATAPVTRAPRRGEHTDEVLMTLLDMDAADLKAAREGGAFGALPNSALA